MSIASAEPTIENPTQTFNQLNVSTELDLTYDELNYPTLSADPTNREDVLIQAKTFCTDMGKLFDRGFGLTAWLRGKVLIQLKPLNSARGILDHGEFNVFLRDLGYSVATGHNYRSCADRFTRQEAIALGYDGMRETIKSEKGDKDTAEAQEAQENGTTEPEEKPEKKPTLKDFVAQITRFSEAVKKLPRVKDVHTLYNKTAETKGAMTNCAAKIRFIVEHLTEYQNDMLDWNENCRSDESSSDNSLRLIADEQEKP